MPRTASLSGQDRRAADAVEAQRADGRPVAGDVADRAPGLGDAEPTGHRPPPARADRGRGLAGDDQAELDATLPDELLDGAQAASAR